MLMLYEVGIIVVKMSGGGTETDKAADKTDEDSL
jgi:Sec-independent protein secretion pathway component TatC